MKNLLFSALVGLGSFSFGQTCSIEQNGVYELNLFGSDDVFFYTAPNHLQNPNADAYHYDWEFTFEDGSIDFSSVREPQIPVSCTNRVEKVKVTVNNGTCSKVIQKTFRPKVCGTGGL